MHADGVEFVEADFSDETWLSSLTRRASYRRRVPTMFVLEGVIYYLAPHTVEATVSSVAEHVADCCAKENSCLVFDYFSFEFVLGKRPGVLTKLLRGMLSLSGEPLRFGVPRTRSRNRRRTGSRERGRTVYYDAYSDIHQARPAIADFVASTSDFEVVYYVAFASELEVLSCASLKISSEPFLFQTTIYIMKEIRSLCSENN